MPNPADLLALLPFLSTLVFALLIILTDAFHRTEGSRAYIANLAGFGMLVTLGITLFISTEVGVRPVFDGMIIHDHFSIFINALLSIIAAITIFLSPGYLQEKKADHGEYYALIMLATAGMMLMAAAGDLVIIFLGFEIMSVSSFALVGFLRRSQRSAEGAMKFFFLSALSSAVFLYGSALLYGTTGSTQLNEIHAAITASAAAKDNVLVLGASSAELVGLDPLLFVGIAMVLGGLFAKIAVVPFHMWVPDTYEGAPPTTAGFLATAAKIAGFAALMRVLFLALRSDAALIGDLGWVQITFALAMLTIVVGNLTALTQKSVKRMLAYSSIAHVGYALVGLTAAGYLGRTSFLHPGDVARSVLGNASVLLYLATYTFATLGAFGVLSYLSRKDHEIETYEDLGGVGHQHPLLGAMLSIFMLSSAGLPPTVGFIGKLHVFQMAITAGSVDDDSGFFWLVAVAAIASLLGVYYCLKVIVFLYMKPSKRPVTPLHNPLARFWLAVCAAITIGFGFYPAPMIQSAHEAVRDFGGPKTRARIPGTNSTSAEEKGPKRQILKGEKKVIPKETTSKMATEPNESLPTEE